MASLNGNSCYFTINGVSFSAYWIKFNLKGSVESVDVTHGSGATHVDRNAGLKDAKATLDVAYEVGSIPTITTGIQPGNKYSIVYGPESNTAGKPKDDRTWLFTGAEWTQEVTKSHVIFSIECEGCGTPATDFWAGGTF